MKRIYFFLIILTLIGSASAGYTMNLQTSSEVISSEEARITFSLNNSGDETAYRVALQPVLPEGFSSDVLYIRTLPPHQPVNSSIPLKINSSVIEGRYPVVLVLHYSDKNGYPFSVLFPESLNYNGGKSSKVQLALTTVEITGPSPVEFDVKVFNQDTKAHNVTVRLYTPNELTVDLLSQNMQLKKQSSMNLDNEIRSNGALYDSNYLILASASYVEDGKLYSSMAQGRVMIVKPSGLQIGENVFMESQWLLILIVFIVMVVLVVLLLKQKPIDKNDNKKGAKKELRGRKN